MELLKYCGLVSLFAVVTAYYAPNYLDFSSWPDAVLLNQRDRGFIMEKFINQAVTRRKIPPPTRLLKALITQNRYATQTVTDYDAVYLANEGSTCVGKITVTVKTYCGQGVVCTSSQQTVQCYPPGYPGLRV